MLTLIIINYNFIYTIYINIKELSIFYKKYRYSILLIHFSYKYLNKHLYAYVKSYSNFKLQKH